MWWVICVIDVVAMSDRNGAFSCADMQNVQIITKGGARLVAPDLWRPGTQGEALAE